MIKTSVFPQDWVQAYADEWNADASFVDTLREAGFSARVAYGLPDEQAPVICLDVRNGKVSPAEPVANERVDWDLRAHPDQWQDWLESPPGLFALGVAFTNRRLQFRSGDYPSMIKNPPIAGSFVHSFVLMSRAYQRLNSQSTSAGEKPA